MQVDLVQATTRDGVRLDGAYQRPVSSAPTAFPLDAVCMVHGTGSNFYGSTLFDALTDCLLATGCAVLRINTRGHDGISTAATAKGGRRLGAAYEVVDDCRHDLAAWIEWLEAHGNPRIGLIGHSLGAVKSLYAAAHEPKRTVKCVIAISPPRLSYAEFCCSSNGKAFLECYHEAERFVESGRSHALLEVQLPLPMIIAAAGYLEKYGPDEKYNYTKFLPSVPCPTLITLGTQEMAGNIAFQGAPEAIASVLRSQARVTVATIEGADHFYTGVRSVLTDRVQTWLGTLDGR